MANEIFYLNLCFYSFLALSVNSYEDKNIQDLVLVASQFERKGVNGNGVVNILYITMIAKHFGEEPSKD